MIHELNITPNLPPLARSWVFEVSMSPGVQEKKGSLEAKAELQETDARSAAGDWSHDELMPFSCPLVLWHAALSLVLS